MEKTTSKTPSEDKLNLGCGYNYYDGWINVDYPNSVFKKDVAWDLNNLPLPFKDKSMSYILISETLNYLDPKKSVDVIVELWRILKDGGELEIRLPHFSSFSAYGFKNRAFSIKAFDTFTDVDTQRYVQGLPKQAYELPMFKMVEKKLYYQRVKNIEPKKGLYYYFAKFISYLANKNTYFCEKVWCYWFGGFQEFVVVLKKVGKG